MSTATQEADRPGLRAIALLEFSKGVLVTIVAVGILWFRYHDVTQITLRVIHHFHLDPASRGAAHLIHAAEKLGHADLRAFAALGFAYATVRFIEAIGLWRDKTWGSMIGAWSGALYLPFESVELYKHPDWSRLLLLLVNLAIVAFLVHHLRSRCRTE